MELNCEISCNLDILDKYHENYKWIPSSSSVRPDDNIIREKQEYLENIEIFYTSIKDFILVEIMDNRMELTNDGKIEVKEVIRNKKFIKNKFPYNISGTNHYIMWYYGMETLCSSQITNDIYQNIFDIVNNEKFNFVWYENPKMNLPEIYHVQVFWIKE